MRSRALGRCWRSVCTWALSCVNGMEELHQWALVTSGRVIKMLEDGNGRSVHHWSPISDVSPFRATLKVLRAPLLLLEVEPGCWSSESLMLQDDQEKPRSAFGEVTMSRTHLFSGHLSFSSHLCHRPSHITVKYWAVTEAISEELSEETYNRQTDFLAFWVFFFFL